MKWEKVSRIFDVKLNLYFDLNILVKDRENKNCVIKREIKRIGIVFVLTSNKSIKISSTFQQ